MKRAAIALAAILAASPALACHHYSRWYYRTPQPCPVSSPMAFARPASPARTIERPLASPAQDAPFHPASPVAVLEPAKADSDADRRRGLELLKTEMDRLAKLRAIGAQVQ